MFALDSLSLHHKLYQRNFVFAKFGKSEVSLLRNFVKPKFRLSRHGNFASFNESSWLRTKDKIRLTFLSLLLHSTVRYLFCYYKILKKYFIINIIIIIINNNFFHKEFRVPRDVPDRNVPCSWFYRRLKLSALRSLYSCFIFCE